ncbi:hypothetical protein ACBQ16_12650 [Halopseudomonas bauzanensis]|uniref:hypothetical protein n=1 Tax=Halopseudomonas bauzanensis TaxID=653930 RepID=UPI0035246347
MEASQTSSPRRKVSFAGGGQPLWKAFWILYVLGSLSFTATAFVLTQLSAVHYALSQASHTLNLQTETTLIMAAAAIAVAYIVYFLFCSISVWRCSINTGNRYWPILAKSIISMHFAWISWKVFVALGSLVNYFFHQ